MNSAKFESVFFTTVYGVIISKEPPMELLFRYVRPVKKAVNQHHWT